MWTTDGDTSLNRAMVDFSSSARSPRAVTNRGAAVGSRPGDRLVHGDQTRHTSTAARTRSTRPGQKYVVSGYREGYRSSRRITSPLRVGAGLPSFMLLPWRRRV